MIFRSRETKTERKRLTLMLVSIPGFAAVVEDSGPEETVDLLSRFLALCGRVTEQNKGFVARSERTYFLAVIPDPGEGNYDPCQIGLSILNESSQLKVWARTRRFKEPKLAVVMATGECVVERKAKRGTVLYGGIINKLDRLFDRFAGDGDILVLDDSVEHVRLTPDISVSHGVRTIRLTCPSGTTMHDLEANIVHSGIELLKCHAARLAACGRTWRGPDIEVWQSEPERYTSEIRVTILKGDEIDDVLEFYIYDKGQPVVTEEEALNWFKKQLDVLESR